MIEDLEEESSETKSTSNIEDFDISMSPYLNYR